MASHVLELQSLPPSPTRTRLTFVYGLPLMALELLYVPITHYLDFSNYVLWRATLLLTVGALLWPILATVFTTPGPVKARIYTRWCALLLLGTVAAAIWLVLDPNQLTSYVTP